MTFNKLMAKNDIIRHKSTRHKGSLTAISESTNNFTKSTNNDFRYDLIYDITTRNWLVFFDGSRMLDLGN